MSKLSTERAIDALDTVRAYYASLTAGYPKGKDCKAIGDVMCSEIANSCLMAIKALRQEQKTGRWFLSGGYWRCSECKEKALLKLDKSMGGCKEYMPIKSKYCYNCGAKMQEE